jgi:aspartyl-tRNA synthetase
MSISPGDPAATALRTARAGELRAGDAGRRVRLGGWVHRVRDLGGVVFLDLRDRAGMVQLSFDPQWTPPEALAAVRGVGQETVVMVDGTVALRPESARDTGLATREIEVKVSGFQVVGPALTPAIPVSRKEGEELPAEELRLKHRVLDLRRGELQDNILLRHRLLQRSRRCLSDLQFLEIETPILTRPTPEGARDYLVPSRVHPGEFYALPQSPQLYKQLLMVAGFDRYFQIARCFRDEDLRADRQPEFTQIDIEASFVSQEDVQDVIEQVLVALWDEAAQPVSRPFRRLAWREAMERYGSDKPDLRFGFELTDFTGQLGADAADFLREARAKGERLRGIVASEGARLSRKDLDQLTELVRRAGGRGLLWARRTASGWEGQGTKALGADTLKTLGGSPGDLLLGVAGPDSLTSAALQAVRGELINRLSPKPLEKHAFCWIVDFPLFELDPATGRHTFAHHPFTSPHPEDRSKLETDPASCRALHYDAVYNGVELGSGSIRITDPELQQTVFGLLGIDREEGRRRFGFLLDGLAAGAPPHGGFAVGFDRVSMLLAGATSLRDVIAFPKTTAARALFEGAPTPVGDEELKAVHLRVSK